MLRLIVGDFGKTPFSHLKLLTSSCCAYQTQCHLHQIPLAEIRHLHAPELRLRCLLAPSNVILPISFIQQHKQSIHSVTDISERSHESDPVVVRRELSHLEKRVGIALFPAFETVGSN